MAKRVVRDVVHNVVRDGKRHAGDNGRGHAAIIRRARAPAYLVCRRGVYFFQIRVPDALVPCRVVPPIRVRLGRLPRREAQLCVPKTPSALMR
jgi:hypothetical protein